jgi:hypothetical protein
MVSRINQRWQRFVAKLTVRRLGAILLLSALPGMIWASAVEVGAFRPLDILITLYNNFSWEVAATAFAVLFIDQMYQIQETKQQKQGLIRQLTSSDPRQAFDALAQLRAQGWLQSGDLHGADLHHARLAKANLHGASLVGVNLHLADLAAADLEEADLTDANLQWTNLRGVDLSQANLTAVQLEGADLRSANLREVQGITDEMLTEVKYLLDARMPDGGKYDGRYNLIGDLQLAKAAGYATHDATAMARFYDVSRQTYESTQTSRNQSG